MITSVLERYREIGIMKAVGARNAEIFKIFLFEAGFLGFVAGVIGILFGWGITYAGMVIMDNMGWGFLTPHYSWALFLGLINYLKRKEIAHAISTICWMWFLIGSFYMWLHWGGISKITVWFGEGLPMLGALVIAPITLMFLVLAKADGIMAGFNHTVEAFIETLGHTLSFCRIAALFLTHAALNSIFLQLGNVENGHFTLKAIPFILLGAVLSLGIEGLLVMVHVLRLHWVELLPKFYSGKGTPFKPIKIKQKTNITPGEKLWTQN